MQGALLVAAAVAVGGLICRLTKLHPSEHRAPVWLLHLLLCIAAGWAGTSALAGEAAPVDFATVGAALCWLWVSWATWANGEPPAYARRAAPRRISGGRVSPWGAR